MSREFKFRVWSKNLRKYVSGMLIDEHGEPFSLQPGYEICEENINNYIIEPFTGLKDKNGKEIYEGDLVRASVPLGSGAMEIGEVAFGEGAFYLKGGDLEKLSIYDRTLPMYNHATLEIIGNIHIKEGR